MAKKCYRPVKTVSLDKPKYNVMGIVHPFRPEYRVAGKVPEGTTVYDAIHDACKMAKIRPRLINYGVAQIGKRDYEKQITRWEFIPFSQWKKHKLEKDELLRFRILPRGGGGGGGGKSIMNTILSIVVAVAAVAAAFFTAGASIFAEGAALAGYGGLAGGLAGMAVLTIGQALVNAIAPVKAPSIGSFSDNTSRAEEPDVYSISAGRNSVNQWGRVPVPVGRGRFAPPKGASPYTQLSGDDQYLHELFCLGIGDMQISAIKIGNNPIEDYNDCLYEIMTYDPNDPKAPLYYPAGIYEETLNIQLKKGVNNVRTTNECIAAEVDLSFQGLCYLDDNGNPTWTKCCFKIQYRKSDGTAWKSIGNSKFYNGIQNAQPSGSKVTGVVGINLKTGVFLRTGENNIEKDELRLGYFTISTKEQEYSYTLSGYGDSSFTEDYTRTQVRKYKNCKFTKDQDLRGHFIKGFEVTEYSGDANNFERWGFSVASGYVYDYNPDEHTTEFCVDGAQTRLLRRTCRIDFPEKGVYAISVTRLCDDSYDSRLQNDSYWTALRSITDELPVKTKYPVMLLSLQVKATGQISGSLENLTVYYETKCYDWDVPNQKWIWRYTSNPASIFRYILQQKNAFSRPQPNSLLDLTSIKDAYEYYDAMKFNYDKVFDSSTSIFERLVAIGATALSSPTMLEGKWGIIADRPRSNVVCAFTSANAWQWQFERTQVRLPNAIHCNFVNEETWDADMRVVKTDEIDDGNYLYETQEYDGVVDPKQVYLLARFHYADAKMRRRTITFRAFDEAILCTRGDLVELACPNVSVQGLQVGRIRKVNKNANGDVISVATDQINTTDYSGRTFGVRIYNDAGEIFIAKVKAENKSQRLLTFQTPQSMRIEKGDKYAFGDYSEEVFQAVVLGMKFNTDWTCDVTCQDYIPAIYGDLSKPIPDWTSVITRPIEFKWELTSTPIIVRIVSDETAIVRGSDGTLSCRMIVYMKDPTTLDSRAKYYSCEVREVQDETNPNNIIYGQWYDGARGVPIEQSYFYVADVDEGKKYQVRVKYAGEAGQYGAWSKVVEHTVVGKTTRPPDVKNFKAVIDNPNGIKLSWTMLNVADIVHYAIGGAVNDTVLASPVIEKVYRRTGVIPFTIVAVDAGGRTSKNPANASVTVYAPNNPVFQSAQLLNPGIVLKWGNAKTTWNIAKYEMACAGVTGTATGLTGTLPFSGNFPKGAFADLSCVDIFENPSAGSGSRKVTIYPPETPQVKIGFNKLNGNVTLDWQDCTNKTVTNAPAIDHYEILGTLANNQVVDVKGTHYESIVPLIVYEFGAGSIEGGIPVHVGNLYIKVSAVDKYGIRSEDDPNYKDNTINMAIWPPYNPTNFGVSASLSDNDKLKVNWTESTAIMLTWRDCERTFAIDYYLVYDFYTQTEYKVATNYVVLPARKMGSYRLTVKAVDVLGLESANMEYNMTIAGVGGQVVKAKIDGSDILLEWNTPDSSFQIDHYIIFEDNDDLPSGDYDVDSQRAGFLGTAKTNYFRIPAKNLGTFTYYVWAVDVAGNINTDFANYVSITVAANKAPTVSAVTKDLGVLLSWEIKNKSANSLPVVAWDVRRYDKINASQVNVYTPIQDYGRRDTNKLQVDAFAAGNYSFFVRAIDSGGNVGAWGKVDFTAKKPGQVVFSSMLAIDNNIMLYWLAPPITTFPIKEYIFDEIDPDGYSMRIGTVDALFASESEKRSGTYVYAITPVDWGGNVGTASRATVKVSQPPDFIFYDDYDSLFNGTKTRLILDGQGHMIGPMSLETWEQQIARMKTLAGTDITTWQQKIAKGWDTWLEPAETDGKYVEVIDHGAFIQSTNYSVTFGYEVINGKKPERMTLKVEISADGKDWVTVADNLAPNSNVYCNQFRYSRITFNITGGFIKISQIHVTLDVKKQTDRGRVESKFNDNGAGYTDDVKTPMLKGTWVPFNIAFTDVQSFPRPNVAQIRDKDGKLLNANALDYMAYTVFEDVLYPKGFRVFVLDKNGNRVTATVDWAAYGV